MDQLEQIRETFRKNLESVDKLINFDREVQDWAITNIEALHKRLKEKHFDNPQLNGERTLEILKKIRQNDSLRSRYKTIFNQALVLLVSHFGSAVGDIFRYALSKELEKGKNSRLLKEELRISVGEIVDALQYSAEVLPEFFVSKKDISFQDMQSIHRAFKDYTDISMERTEDVNDIILSQACRHVIVHRGGIADSRLIKQVKIASPRRLKVSIKEKEAVEFTPDELSSLASSMSKYVDILCDQVVVHMTDIPGEQKANKISSKRVEREKRG